MHSHHPLKIQPINFNTDPESILERLASPGINLVKKKYIEGHNFIYELVGKAKQRTSQLKELYKQFIVAADGNTYFVPDLVAAKNSFNQGRLPEAKLLTNNPNVLVDIENYAEHSHTLVHNQVYADMLLSAHFLDMHVSEKEKKLEKQADLPNKLVDITRPKCMSVHTNAPSVIFPCGFYYESDFHSETWAHLQGREHRPHRGLFESMRFYYEPRNIAAEGLILRFFQEKFEHLSALSDFLCMTHQDMQPLLQQTHLTPSEDEQVQEFSTQRNNLFTIEKQRVTLLAELESLKKELEEDRAKFMALTPLYAEATAKHPAQEATSWYLIHKKQKNAASYAKDWKEHKGKMITSLFTGIGTIPAFILMICAAVGKQPVRSYSRIAAYRDLADKHGALLQDHITAADAREVAHIEQMKAKKTRYKNSYNLYHTEMGVKYLIDPDKILHNIQTRIDELKSYILLVQGYAPRYATEFTSSSSSSTAVASNSSLVQNRHRLHFHAPVTDNSTSNAIVPYCTPGSKGSP